MSTSIIRTLAAISAAGALLPLGSARATEPFACVGSPNVPPAYACVVSVDVGVDPPDHVTGTGVVVFYDGTCYYIHPDGSVETRRAASANDC